MNKSAVVTGAAGFAGIHLTEHLLEKDYRVLAVLRPASEHNARIDALFARFPEGRLKKLVLDRDKEALSESLAGEGESYVFFFDLAWGGGREDTGAQLANLLRTQDAVAAAKKLGCRRFIGIGSQAEYGLKTEPVTEKSLTEPFSAYGAAKLAACHLSRIAAAQAGLEWIWGRIFSLTGRYEAAGRMLPDLVRKMEKGETAQLSSCEQYWDYLDAGDCAEALIALSERGRSGEIYNIAHGGYRPLKEYVEELRRELMLPGGIVYGGKAEPFVNLMPVVSKLKADTGWEPRVSFTESVRSIDV